jgi:hypothetical protein
MTAITIQGTPKNRLFLEVPRNFIAQPLPGMRGRSRSRRAAAGISLPRSLNLIYYHGFASLIL